jgi:hypothetical protein
MTLDSGTTLRGRSDKWTCSPARTQIQMISWLQKFGNFMFYVFIYLLALYVSKKKKEKRRELLCNVSVIKWNECSLQYLQLIYKSFDEMKTLHTFSISISCIVSHSFFLESSLTLCSFLKVNLSQSGPHSF